MSNEILVALIGLVGVLLGALINGIFAIISSLIQSFSKPQSNNGKGLIYPPDYQPRPKPSLSRRMLFGGIIGLVVGLSFVVISPTVKPNPTQKLFEDTPIVLTTSNLLYETLTQTQTQTITQTQTQTITPTFTQTITPTVTYTLTPTFTSTNTSTPTPIVIFDNSVPMILIPNGEFNKYDKANGYIKVILSNFYIDQHEVTNGEYKKCVDEGVCARPFEAGSNYQNVEHFDDPAYNNYPIVLISYNRAKAYCEWRNSGTRLPTGAEWEKAARGKLVGQTYPWGNYPPSCELGTINGTNYSECKSRDAFPVMSFAPNGYGLFDMSGNVSEWVDEANKLIRGGSWNANESQIKVFSSVEGNTFEGYVNVGFRCAKDAP